MPSAHFKGNDFEWWSSDAGYNYIFRVNLIISNATQAISLCQQITAGGILSQMAINL